MPSDTIAAVASGMTASGIGIIRISGPEAFSILEKVFRPKRGANVREYKGNTVHYGHIVRGGSVRGDTVSGGTVSGSTVDGTVIDGSLRGSTVTDDTVSSGTVTGGTVIDECLVTIFRAPHSYTAEDTAEINTHGGVFVMQRVLDTVLSAGARAAEPGEFTKRAFLNGRIDLTEAEAVMDVISAKSDDALVSSLLQLSGSVRRRIEGLREKIMDELAFIEAALDDPEHYELSDYGETMLAHLAPVAAALRHLSGSFGEGHLIREGILTVILGKPNAGKSSLLNALSGEDRAIVTEIEGTTRDILEEQVRLGALSLRVIDTAGIRDAADRIEQIGIGRAKEYASRADLILALFDAATALDENDRGILELIKDKRAILLLNKSDLAPVTTPEMLQAVSGKETQVLTISAKDGSGLKELEEAVRALFFSGGLRMNEEAVITSARHKQAIDAALASYALLEESVRSGMPEDVYAIDLTDMYKRLGEVIGEDIGDDLADAIFSRFCMGK